MIFRIILSTAIVQMRQSIARPMYRFCLFMNPIINSILLYEMFLNSGKTNFQLYVILSSGLMTIWSCICFSSIGDIQRERYMGTLSYIFLSPIGFGKVILGKIFGNTILAFFSIILTFSSVRILFGLNFEIENLGLFILTIPMLVVCFSVISIFVSYALTISRKTNLYMNVVEIPVTLLCGFIFPTDVLPKYLLPVSYALPPTWAVKIMYQVVEGVFIRKDFYTNLLVLVIEVVLYAFLAYFLQIYIQNKVRISATLEVC